MKIIGITGNIASGKSTVSKIVANHLDVPLISVDEFSKNWIKTYELYVRSIIEKYDIEIKNIDTFDLIRNNIFSNKSLKRRLKLDISKPFWNYIWDIRFSYNMIVIEHPLMFELNHAYHFHFVLGVLCDHQIRVDRMKNRGYSAETIKERIAAQIRFQKNAKFCDLVINTTNNPTPEYVIQKLRDSERFEALVSQSAIP